MKFDDGKRQWDLFPFDQAEEMVKVLEIGAKKYAPFNWQLVVKEKPRRYWNAAIRHLVAWLSGEKNDKESGLNHLAHAGCCVLFLLWYDQTRREK